MFSLYPVTVLCCMWPWVSDGQPIGDGSIDHAVFSACVVYPMTFAQREYHQGARFIPIIKQNTTLS